MCQMHPNSDVQLCKYFLTINSDSSHQKWMKFAFIVTGSIFLQWYRVLDRVITVKKPCFRNYFTTMCIFWCTQKFMLGQKKRDCIERRILIFMHLKTIDSLADIGSNNRLFWHFWQNLILKLCFLVQMIG